MAGIGFELRRYLADDSFTGTLKAYGYAGLISAGPWVLSILGVLLVGLIALYQGADVAGAAGVPPLKQFTTAITWLMGASLILTGLLQLLFTRFIADRLYEERVELINPNLFGALVLTTLCSGGLGVALALLLFRETFAVELLLLANLVVLCNVWIVLIFVAGLKRLKLIVTAFLCGYLTMIGLSAVLLPLGLPGLLAGSLIGHGVLLFFLLGVVIPQYPVHGGIRFDFLRRRQIFPSLIFVGLFYNLGIWVDKLIFWLTPSTSEVILGPLRSSLIYDLPIFLAYLSIIPGMAVFLLRIETDFAEAHGGFYAAVRGNASLQEITALGSAMTTAVRDGLYQIVRVQLVTILLLYLAGPSLLAVLGMSANYVHLFYVNLIGVAAQVLMLAVLNVLFYLDRLHKACWLTGLMLVTNTLFSWITLQLGPIWYGYGFGLSMSSCALLGVWMLGSELHDIEFRTFMRARPKASGATREVATVAVVSEPATGPGS